MTKGVNNMVYSIRYGVDRCPATKNYSHAVYCRNCDFKGTEKKDCCECIYYQLGQKDLKTRSKVH